MRFNRFVSLLLVFTLVVSSTGVATAQSDQPAWAEDTFEDFSGMVDEFNAQIGSVDFGPAEGRLAGKTANVYVESGADTATMSFSMNEDQQITDLSLGTTENADLAVRTDRATIREMTDAAKDDDPNTNPAAIFRDAYRSGDITIKSEGGFFAALSRGGLGDWAFWTAADLFKGFF